MLPGSLADSKEVERQKLRQDQQRLTAYFSTALKRPPIVTDKHPAPAAANPDVAAPLTKKASFGFDYLQSKVVKLASDDLVQDLASQQQLVVQLQEENQKLKERKDLQL